MHIGTNKETKTSTRDNSNNSMIDSPEIATNADPTITTTTLNRPPQTEISARFVNGFIKLSDTNVACPSVAPAATARHKLNMPMVSTICNGSLNTAFATSWIGKCSSPKFAANNHRAANPKYMGMNPNNKYNNPAIMHIHLAVRAVRAEATRC